MLPNKSSQNKEPNYSAVAETVFGQLDQMEDDLLLLVEPEQEDGAQGTGKA
jgi:hypothetical protein